MIPIQQQLEPKNFDKKVRQKGKAFLQKSPSPRTWKNHEYWRESLQDLHKAYNGICAYSAHWIPEIEGSSTVDHFIPKSVEPALAYEWENFRLSCLKMNARKRDFQDVLDPFKINYGWFVLNFPSLLIKPSLDLDESVRNKIKKTIKRLKLNHDDLCVQNRLRWILDYCKNEITYDFLRKNAPFIAYELERQELVDTISSMMLIS